METEENIYTLLDGYGIRDVVVDSLFLDISQKVLLQKVLQNPKSFRHMKTYQMMTNTQFYKKVGLDVYEYLQDKMDYNQVITVDMPVMEAGYSFTVNKLRKPPTSDRNE